MPTLNATRNKAARRRIAWLICAIPVLLVLLVLGNEYRYLQNNTVSHLPPGWPEDKELESVPLGAPVLWRAASLADKINGKAELYLAAGFVAMHSARYALLNQPELFFEVQLFQQSGPESAFAVFSQQRRSRGRALNWAEHGYATSNALYLQQGSYYLEISGAGTDEKLMAAMSAWAEKWLSRQAGANINPAHMFAPQNLQPDSIMLLAKDAFGLAGFDNVWVAQYNLPAGNCLLFVKPAANGAEAREITRHLHDFWVMQGARPLDSASDDSSAFELEGLYELITVQGHYVLGAHEAPGLENGRFLLDNLRAHLARR